MTTLYAACGKTSDEGLEEFAPLERWWYLVVSSFEGAKFRTEGFVLITVEVLPISFCFASSSLDKTRFLGLRIFSTFCNGWRTIPSRDSMLPKDLKCVFSFNDIQSVAKISVVSFPVFKIVSFVCDNLQLSASDQIFVGRFTV